MGPFVRLLLWNWLIGFALSAAFVAILLGFNIANLRHLVLASDMGMIAVFMLFMFNGIVFAGVQASMRILAMHDDNGGGGKPVSVKAGDATALSPVTVPVAKP